MQYIAFDSHKHYTWASVESVKGGKRREARIGHERGALRQFLGTCERGSPVAVETIGNWYWIVDEIEAAGMVPHLVHARKAKLMMGSVNKTDKLDARGMNQLQRAGTLPEVWIPPACIRDARELPRTRMVLARQRSRLKNRIHATLAKYALRTTEVSDLFGKKGRILLKQHLQQLPLQTRYATEQLLQQLDLLIEQIDGLEQRMEAILEKTPQMQLVMSLPGVGFILGAVIALEVGDVTRFPSAGHLAAYAGTTPRIHASGGKVRHGNLRQDVNRYLKWAYGEAASVVARQCQHPQWRKRHVSRLYQRIAQRRGHPKAIGALMRHLAEATYWMLTKGESYQEPAKPVVSSTQR